MSAIEEMLPNFAPSKAKAFYSNGGSLILSEYVPGVSVVLSEEGARYYHGKYFVGESMTYEAAEMIAEALGFEWVDGPSEAMEDQR